MLRVCFSSRPRFLFPPPSPPPGAENQFPSISQPTQFLADEIAPRTFIKTAARIKRNRKTQQIKFKVRCHRFLYTLVLKDSDKADKLKQSLPPSTISSPHRPLCLFSCGKNALSLPKTVVFRTILTVVGLSYLLDLTSTINDVPKKNKKGKRVA